MIFTSVNTWMAQECFASQTMTSLMHPVFQYLASKINSSAILGEWRVNLSTNSTSVLAMEWMYRLLAIVYNFETPEAHKWKQLIAGLTRSDNHLKQHPMRGLTNLKTTTIRIRLTGEIVIYYWYRSPFDSNLDEKRLRRTTNGEAAIMASATTDLFAREEW